jgi:hypothetical protein
VESEAKLGLSVTVGRVFSLGRCRLVARVWEKRRRGGVARVRGRGRGALCYNPSLSQATPSTPSPSIVYFVYNMREGGVSWESLYFGPFLRGGDGGGILGVPFGAIRVILRLL